MSSKRPVTIYLGLGSNLGNRLDYICQALEQLQSRHIAIEKISSVIETKPVGGPAQSNFLNAVARAKTTLPPAELLAALKMIETALGRKKTVRNGPRTIDIDILLYSRQKIKTPKLIVPHPRMLKRDFVMKPLAEIAPKVAGRLQHQTVKNK